MQVQQFYKKLTRKKNYSSSTEAHPCYICFNLIRAGGGGWGGILPLFRLFVYNITGKKDLPFILTNFRFLSFCVFSASFVSKSCLEAE